MQCSSENLTPHVRSRLAIIDRGTILGYVKANYSKKAMKVNFFSYWKRSSPSNY